MTPLPKFKAADAALIRAAAYPTGLKLPLWPDLTSDDPVALLMWLRPVWSEKDIVRVVSAASPSLARTLTDLCEGRAVRPRQARRSVMALVRYLLRWTSRPTPFGLFAGVAPAGSSDRASVRWGEQHTVVERPDAVWLAELIEELEADPHVLQHVPVQVNGLGFARGAEWVVPCQPAGDGTFADVSVTTTAGLRRILEETGLPVAFGTLLKRLSTEFPEAPTGAIEGMLTELVRCRVLLTGLRPPMTSTDPLQHIAAQVDGLVTADRLEYGDRSAVDLRLDCAVTLPPVVLRAAEEAASVLAVLGPERPTWRAYHAAFLERYGPGAVVPVREVVDPDIGLGYPADYRGSFIRPTQQVSPRDIALARIAEEAVLDGRTEVVLNEQAIADLACPSPGSAVPHTELRFALHAPSPAALDSGDFTLTVVSASRHAGTTVGRFLYLLDQDERDRFARTYRDLPTSIPGALTVQLSCPPLADRTGNLARTSPVLPILSIGEHRAETDLSVDTLALTADVHRFLLLSTTTGQTIEPVMLNAVDLRHGTHPLVRFLCEVSTGRSMPCRPFFWGRVADRLPFLPRVRHGRAVLSPARWRITSDRLPSADVPWDAWIAAFQEHQTLWRIPNRVQIGDDDVLLRLDLTERAHLALLREHMNREKVTQLTEAATDFDWIGGRPHEIVLPLANASVSTTPARPVHSRRTSTVPDHFPGASPWLYAHLFGHPGRQSDLLTLHLPGLLAEWTAGPSEDWWFIRYRDPEPHLRLRLRLHSPQHYGRAAQAIGSWASTLYERGLLRDLALNTYRPETGRFGDGPTMTAAEHVFAADSAVVVAQLRNGRNACAAVAASYLDIAMGFLGVDAPRWLIDHISHEGGPSLDRTSAAQAHRPLELPAGLRHRRRQALSAYRSHLDDEEIDGALADLLHLHHVRMIGIDPESERLCLRLARAVAQRLYYTGRSRPSTLGNSVPGSSQTP